MRCGFFRQRCRCAAQQKGTRDFDLPELDISQPHMVQAIFASFTGKGFSALVIDFGQTFDARSVSNHAETTR